MKIEKIHYGICDSCRYITADLIEIKKWFCKIRICKFCLKEMENMENMENINKKSNG